MNRIRNRIASILWIAAVGMLLGGCTQVDEGLELFAGGDPVVTYGDSGDDTQLLEGATVSGEVRIELPFKSRRIVRTDFYLDGVPGEGTDLGSDDSDPFEVLLDTTAFEDGAHQLVILVVANGRRGERLRLYEVSFFIDNRSTSPPASPPASPPTNVAPTVSAGPDKSVTLPAAATLVGSADDDGLPSGSLTLQWSKQSGPGTVAFSAATSATSNASFGAAGSYVLRLTANDGSLSSFDEVTVTVAPAASTPTPAPLPAGDTDLRGAPGFSVSQLTPQARQWYERLWSAIDDPQQYPNALTDAQRGDLYYLGRYVNVHVTTMLTAFRYTGDLRLLDEMDVLMQAARSTLADTNGDGYLNWRWLKDANNSSWYGNDFHEMDETMTHAFIAVVAWAYQNNRDLSSPAGVAYGERADFWLDYLQNHFEAKWRQRSGRSFPRMDFLNYYLLHPWTQYTRYFWYMYRLTGQSAYLTEAERRAGVVLDNMVSVSTPQGPGYVYSLGVVSEGSPYNDLMPVVYGQYVTQAVQDLYLDGFAGFSSSDLQMLARGTSHFIIDNATTDYAMTVGGDSSVGGLPLKANDGRKGGSFWAIWSYAPALTPFDDGGEVASNAEALHNSIEANVGAPRRIFLSGGLFLRAHLNGN